MEVAIGYIRVSGLRQVKEGNSLATQDDLVRDYIARKYKLDRIFREEGETAKTADRTVLQEMLGYARTNRHRIDVLVIPKIDRLARNTSDYINLKLQFQKLGIRIESVGENLQESPTGRLMESVLASVAQFDNEIRAERSMGGMVTAISEGRYIWRAPPGFRPVKFNGRRTIEPDPKTSKLMRWALEQLSVGVREKDVRERLGAAGLKISRSALYKHSRNKAYIGIVEGFGLSVQGAPPMMPLVSEAAFLRLQAVLRRRNGQKEHQRDNGDFPLRGSLYCECGLLLTACWAKGRSRRYAYYRCMECRGVNLRRDQVDHRFLRLLGKERAKLPELTAEFKQLLVEEWHRSNEARTKQLVALDQRITSLRSLQKAIALKNAQGVIPDYLAKEQFEEIGRKLEDAVVERAELEPKEASIEQVLAFASEFLGSIEKHWLAMHIRDQKKLLKHIYPNGIQVARKRRIRTAKMGRITRVKRDVADNPSRTVGSLTLTPNRIASKHRFLQGSSLSGVLACLIDVYDTFGERLGVGYCDLHEDNVT